jgi:hypothetical protein
MIGIDQEGENEWDTVTDNKYFDSQSIIFLTSGWMPGCSIMSSDIKNWCKLYDTFSMKTRSEGNIGWFYVLIQAI